MDPPPEKKRQRKSRSASAEPRNNAPGPSGRLPSRVASPPTEREARLAAELAASRAEAEGLRRELAALGRKAEADSRRLHALLASPTHESSHQVREYEDRLARAEAALQEADRRRRVVEAQWVQVERHLSVVQAQAAQSRASFGRFLENTVAPYVRREGTSSTTRLPHASSISPTSHRPPTQPPPPPPPLRPRSPSRRRSERDEPVSGDDVPYKRQRSSSYHESSRHSRPSPPATLPPIRSLTPHRQPSSAVPIRSPHIERLPPPPLPPPRHSSRSPGPSRFPLSQPFPLGIEPGPSRLPPPTRVLPTLSTALKTRPADELPPPSSAAPTPTPILLPLTTTTTTRAGSSSPLRSPGPPHASCRSFTTARRHPRARPPRRPPALDTSTIEVRSAGVPENYQHRFQAGVPGYGTGYGTLGRPPGGVGLGAGANGKRPRLGAYETMVFALDEPVETQQQPQYSYQPQPVASGSGAGRERSVEPATERDRSGSSSHRRSRDRERSLRPKQEEEEDARRWPRAR
ncbi:hypothetical protein MKEN_00279500 [Mycena kentingensis (nom. inval.)]|nr:hypothetical protein MKEN_00279500 [Mycena kentingensis (nom. inval.)]